MAAYGDVDELNSSVGVCLARLGAAANWLHPRLVEIQKELFIVGSILSGFDAALPKDAVKRLEDEIDAMTEELPKMDKFILPGGSPGGSSLHLARAVCRRAERAAVSLPDAPKDVLIYLNRLSDHLFVAARWANQRAGEPETQWEGIPKR